MKKALIDFCKSIDIECVGIAPPGPYYDFKERWEKQIERGYLTGFEEMDIEKRVDPRLTLETVKSVIVCLFPYYIGESAEGNISKYSYGLDYHIVAKDKLKKIGEFLSENIEGFHYKEFSDIGPLSDRYLAHKAGLGFWGINNHIITDKYGSYVFIGYILNNYPFEADKPIEKTCVQCLKCIKACPGQCIQGDFTINPLKCKSYLTQKKEELTKEEEEIIKKTSLIWGCDVCQNVCPHNKGIEETILEEFRIDLKFKIDCEEISKISNKEFIRRYKHKAFGWRGRKILERNCEIINKNYNKI
jgi:epoxyqueuosine reductase